MDSSILLISLAGVLAGATPVVFAAIGETFTERSGIINLSLNGTIILSSMVGYVVASISTSIILGFLSGALIGAFVAFIIAFSSIKLKQSQIAVGFVLTLLCRDLAYFLGNPFMGTSGPRVPPAFPIPFLHQVPVLGTLLFHQNVLVYLSFILIGASYIWIHKTQSGLILQGIGENPHAAYVRGVNVNKMRYIYTIIGGAFVGLAGPMYSLSFKAGWMGTISGLDGIGWIVLAIVIFGGWRPIRVVGGAYLFAILQWLGLVLQSSLPNIPAQLFQIAPFPLMIFTLLIVNFGNTEWFNRSLSSLPENIRRITMKIIRSIRVSPPSSLGTSFEKE